MKNFYYIFISISLINSIFAQKGIIDITCEPLKSCPTLINDFIFGTLDEIKICVSENFDIEVLCVGESEQDAIQLMNFDGLTFLKELLSDPKEIVNNVYTVTYYFNRDDEEESDENVERICEISSTRQGTCKKVTNCPYLLKQYKRGNILLEHFISCVGPQGQTYVCCPNDNDIYLKPITNDKIISNFNHLVYYQLNLPKTKLRLNERACLMNEMNIFELKNTNINKINFGSYEHYNPYMAALYRKNLDSSYKYHCGGSILSRTFILTAAHCFDLTHVIVGLLRLQEVYTNKEEFLTRIKKYHKHKNYNKGKSYNDIALLELNEAITFNNNIRPACLNTRFPYKAEHYYKISGWGNNQMPEFEQTDRRMLTVPVKIYDTKTCNDKLKEMHKSNLDYRGIIESLFCALGSNENILALDADACHGDSGGPLYDWSEHGKKFYIYGIVSFGSECNTNYPTVYINVTYYLDWIEKVVWPDDY